LLAAGLGDEDAAMARRTVQRPVAVRLIRSMVRTDRVVRAQLRQGDGTPDERSGSGGTGGQAAQGAIGARRCRVEQYGVTP